MLAKRSLKNNSECFPAAAETLCVSKVLLIYPPAHSRLMKCYLLSWQVTEAGFPAKGATCMQQEAQKGSKASIHANTNEGERRKKKIVRTELEC